MSPRPRKHRYCRWHAGERVYKPRGMAAFGLPVARLEADELEALRLCDLEGLTQDEAGERMGVSRGSVQRTVKEARRKLIAALTDGAILAFPVESTTEPTPPGGPGSGHGGRRRGGPPAEM